MTVTLTCEGGTGLALWIGHGTSPTSAYLIFSEKPLPKGMGRSPVNTRAANTAAAIIATPMMENVVFWRCCRSRRKRSRGVRAGWGAFGVLTTPP